MGTLNVDFIRCGHRKETADIWDVRKIAPYEKHEEVEIRIQKVAFCFA